MMRQIKLPRKSFVINGKKCLCLGLIPLLTGCGDESFSDLHQYISQVKAKPKGIIEKLPEIKAIEPFAFKPEELRDPFTPMEQPAEIDGGESGPVVNSSVKKDPTRRKEELEAYPLDGLKMVGTINMKSKLWGLIRASDKTIHRVQIGNYLGKDDGKITRISPDKIEFTEIVADKQPGAWREQQATLALTE